MDRHNLYGLGGKFTSLNSESDLIWIWYLPWTDTSFSLSTGVDVGIFLLVWNEREGELALRICIKYNLFSLNMIQD